jgi:hypothetical protein
MIALGRLSIDQTGGVNNPRFEPRKPRNAEPWVNGRASIVINKPEFAKNKPTKPPKKTQPTSSTTTTTQSTQEVCKPGRPVMFLKTHKTASTTLTNIFLRYAEKYRLLVGLPPERHWELGGYPAKFMKKLVDPGQFR